MNLTKSTHFWLAVLMAALVSIGPAVMVADTTVVVKPSQMDGWAFHLAGGAITSTGGFDSTGPAIPPVGTTSALFTTGPDTESFAELRNTNYNGVKLSDLTALTYWTYVTTKLPGTCVAGFVLLSVDVDGDGVFDPVNGPDDGIFFEPCYQTGTYITDPPGQIIPVQNGGMFPDNTWQMWNALAGGWWSAKYVGFGGPPVTTLPNYIARLAALFPNNPPPTIVNTDSCLGGVRLRAGEGNSWPGFVGNVDKLIIAANGVNGGTNTTFDFEFEPLPIPPCGATPETALSALKFYDANANGVLDPGDPPLANWPITISPLGNAIPNQATQLTDAGGSVTWGNLDHFLNPYTVSEGTPIQSNWVHSTPASVNVNVVVDETTDVRFGNYCTLGSGGRTIGFWGNKNGLGLLTQSDFASLNALKLVNKDGTDRDFTSTLDNNKRALDAWLKKADATNMAYMLSAQLAAMELNVLHGFVDPTKIAPCYGGTIAALITAANDALLADQNTPAGDPHRTTQEALKSCLDSLNNGGPVVSPTPCSYTFAQPSLPEFGTTALKTQNAAPVRFGGKVLFP